MAHPFHSPLYPVVREHASWFVCARELSVLLPELGARATAAFCRYAADQSCYPTELMPLSRAFYLLAGYAAENFVKGCWLREHAKFPPAAAPDAEPFLPPGLAVHSLAQLSNDAGIVLSAEEHETLTFLEQ